MLDQVEIFHGLSREELAALFVVFKDAGYGVAVVGMVLDGLDQMKGTFVDTDEEDVAFVVAVGTPLPHDELGDEAVGSKVEECAEAEVREEGGLCAVAGVESDGEAAEDEGKGEGLDDVEGEHEEVVAAAADVEMVGGTDNGPDEGEEDEVCDSVEGASPDGIGVKEVRLAVG